MLHLLEVDVSTYHFRVHKNVSISYFRVIFMLQCSQRNGVEPFYYHYPLWYISNGLLGYPNGDCMQTLRLLEFDVPTYYLRVYKIVGISFYKIGFRVHHSWWNGVITFYYFSPLCEPSNGLLSNKNRDHIQTLHSEEVGVLTYPFEVNKTVNISSSRAMFRVHYIWRHGVWKFYYFYPLEDHSNSLYSDRNQDLMQSYGRRKLMYQLTP